MTDAVRVVAPASLRPRGGERLLPAVAGFVAASRAEPGCLAYDLQVCATAPAGIATVERWHDATAAADMAAPHTAAFLALAAGCMAAPPAIRTLRLPAGG